MNDYLNWILAGAFFAYSIFLIYNYIQYGNKIAIQDKQWNTFRTVFLVLGILSMVALTSSGNSASDMARIAATIICAAACMVSRDGIGEEGAGISGRFIQWGRVRSWDYEEEKKSFLLHLTVEPKNPKKKDDYMTKTLEFDLAQKELVLKFMRLNLGRKYTRMKKR